MTERTTMNCKCNSYQLLIRGIIAFLSGCFLATGAALAATSAGTAITSTAIVNYQYNSVPQPQESATVNFSVDRVINLVATWKADATVAPGAANQSLLFLVTNTSNTAIRFGLSPVSRATNTWTMNNVRVYRDDNNNGSWDAGDALYADAATYGDIATNASLTVLVVADTPGGLANGQSALYDLIATAVDSGTTTTTAQTGMGTVKSSAAGNLMTIFTVFADAAGSASGDGARDGRHSAGAAYTISGALPAAVVMNKTVAVSDQWGGTQPIPGATLSYAIAVTVTGSGTANSVVIADPLPPDTTYIPGTLRLNGNPLSDAADLDAGDVGGTTADTVTVRLGSLTVASGTNTIIFEVRIK